jgi:hypothetical protein
MCSVLSQAFTTFVFTDEELTDESEPQQHQVPSGAVPLSCSFFHHLLKFKFVSIIYTCLLTGIAIFIAMLILSNLDAFLGSHKLYSCGIWHTCS